MAQRSDLADSTCLLELKAPEGVMHNTPEVNGYAKGNDKQVAGVRESQNIIPPESMYICIRKCHVV